MDKKMDIRCDGKRQYQFVADTAYIREAGTDGEKKAAEYICRELGEAARIETFEFTDFQEKEAEFSICAPFEKKYRVRAYLNGAVTPEEGITAPFLYVEKGDDISLADAKGAVVMICETVREQMCERLLQAKVAGFVTVCGSPLDQGEDRLPVRYRRKECALPGVSIHYLDAMELLEKGATTCHLKVVQEKVTRESANVAIRIEGSECPEEIVTVSAHYDSVPEGPGAYDNMAAGAMVMETYRYFKEHCPEKSVEFIWFGAEEKGLLGSKAYVKAHQEELKHHIFNLNVDLAGQLLGGNVLGVTADPTACASLKELMEENGLGVTIKNQVWASDSNTFAWKGIPALTLNRDGFGMHTRHDTVEWISPWALERGAKTLCTAANWLANERNLPFEKTIPEEMQKSLNQYFG
jgi:hypothetical protein